MPHCELELLGAPQMATCSARKVSEYSKKTNWWCPPPRIERHGVLLVVEDRTQASRERVVGVGLFDVHDERTPSVWCMRIVKEEGLMLRRDDQGKLHRMGVFMVEDDAWFEQGVERRVSLV
jgi:hypothetical protein